MATNTETVLDTFSAATKYEALLLDKGSPGPTEDRMITVFKVLDELVPQLGVYSRIMEMVRDDMFEAVYSGQYTGSGPSYLPNRYIQRVPYFTLVKRVHDDRNERADELQDQLEVVKKRLFDKQKQYEDCLEQISELQAEVANLNTMVQNLEANIQDSKENIEKLERSRDEERENAAKIESDLHCEITDLKEDLMEAKTDVGYLKQYKNGYDDLRDAFHDHHAFEDFTPRRRKRAVVATKRAHLISNIENLLKLEDQIMGVQNATMEEYDRYLEDHKLDLIEKFGTESSTSFEDQEVEMDRIDQQLMQVQERFSTGLEEINTELELLRQHKVMLQEQLQILEESKPHHAGKKRKGLGSRHGSRHAVDSRPTTQESVLSQGLSTGGEDDQEEDSSMDPFSPNERVFSKYAAMIYTSGNGKLYHEFKDARYCVSCGEKTVICPHKIGGEDQMFMLPPGTTHIKITRPKVRINQDMMDNLFRRPVTSEARLDTVASSMTDISGRRVTTKMSVSAQFSPYVGSKTPGDGESEVGMSPGPSLETPLLGGSESHMMYTLQKLWDDFHSKATVDRKVARPLSMERTLSLMEQFAAYLMWQDDYGTAEDGFHSVTDNLYQFISDRYMRPDVSDLATYDLLCAFVEYAGSNKMVQLFANVLIGNLDGAAFRYVLLMGDFIEEVEWKHVEDFRAFASVVYPFLTEDDLENLQMGYTSFSENKISKHLVSEYLIYSIMKYREHRFLETENKLLNHPGKEFSQMTELEFVEATDSVLPVTNDKLRRRLYREAEAHVRKDGQQEEAVPILRLAQITSYLGLLHITNVVKETVAEKVAMAREAASSSRTAKSESSRRSRSVPHADRLITLTGAKNLAHNIARRARRRKARMRRASWED